MIESMNGGGFLNLTGEEAYKTLDELSDNSQRWDFSSRRGKCSTSTKKEGLYEVRDNEDIRGQLKDLMRTVEALALNKPVTAANIYHADVCSLFPAQCTLLKTTHLCQQVLNICRNRSMPSMIIGNQQWTFC